MKTILRYGIYMPVTMFLSLLLSIMVMSEILRLFVVGNITLIVLSWSLASLVVIPVCWAFSEFSWKRTLVMAMITYSVMIALFIAGLLIVGDFRYMHGYGFILIGIVMVLTSTVYGVLNKWSTNVLSN